MQNAFDFLDQGSPTSPGEPENDIPVDETKVKSKKPFLLTSMRPKCSNSKMTSSPITITTTTTTMSMPAMSMSCTERPSNLLNVEQDLETQSSSELINIFHYQYVSNFICKFYGK